MTSPIAQASSLREEALRLDGVSFFYTENPEAVLKQFDLTLYKGEILCLLGASGCGKSTILRLIAGLDEVTSGTILCFGQMLSGTSTHIAPEDRPVGMVFQDFALFPHLSVAKNIGFGLQHLDAEEQKQQIQLCLQQFDLEEKANCYPDALSGGQQQRVALARALARQPNLLLLDEPFSNLDAVLKEKLRGELSKTLREAGVTTIIVTHDPAEAMSLADRIAILEDGKIKQIGTPAELYWHPQSDFIARFLGDCNIWETQITDGLLQTPFGSVPVQAEAFEAVPFVAIRPEALAIMPEHTPNARILSCRHEGGSALLEVAPLGGPATQQSWLIRLNSVIMPQVGQMVHISFDPQLLMPISA